MSVFKKILTDHSLIVITGLRNILSDRLYNNLPYLIDKFANGICPRVTQQFCRNKQRYKYLKDLSIMLFYQEILSKFKLPNSSKRPLHIEIRRIKKSMENSFTLNF